MNPVVLACSDLMTASRFGDPRVELISCRNAQSAHAAVAAHAGALVLVDLQSMPDLAQELRDAGHAGTIVGFAPHVQVELLEAAEPWCDQTLPRGAAIKRFERLVDEWLRVQ